MNCSECPIHENCIQYPFYEERDMVEKLKEMDVKMKYTIDTRKNIYRRFAKRFKKEIKKRMKNHIMVLICLILFRYIQFRQ